MYRIHEDEIEHEAKSAGQLFAKYSFKKEKKTDLNQRQDTIKMFVQEINREREGTKYKPVTGKGIAMKLAHIKTHDLYAFYKQCKSAKSFGAYFYWALKVNKN